MLYVKEEFCEYKLNSDSTQQGQRASIPGGGGQKREQPPLAVEYRRLPGGTNLWMESWRMEEMWICSSGLGSGCERGKDELKQQVKTWKSCDVYGEQQVA